MRRVWLVLSLVAIAGCDNVRDLFTAHADVAAQAGGQSLKVERLAKMMVGVKGMQPTREAAEFLANLWVDYTLFSQAVATGTVINDSASAAQVLWPVLAEMRGTRWHDSLLAHRTATSPEAADSVYRGNDIRVLQHILFRVPQGSAEEVRQAAKKKAEATLVRLKSGADFGKLASQLSEDGSKTDQGFLPPSPRGAFVTSFDSAGWMLGPGSMSRVVETPYGYHLIRRPTYPEARDRLLTWVRQKQSVALDSMYMDSLATQRGIKVLADAPAEIREALVERDKALRSKTKLVEYTGGALTVGELARWVDALGPQFQAQLQQANDSSLRQFAKVIAQNTLLLAQADSAGIKVSAEEWDMLQRQYQASLDTLRENMGLNGSDLTDPSSAPAERSKVAAAKLDTYLENVVGGKIRPRPLPSQLSAVLRQRASYRVEKAGLGRAVELALTERAKAGEGQPAPGVQPAPGPPPVPGGAGVHDSTGPAGSAAQR